MRKAVLSRSYDITYITSERDISLALLEIGAIPSAIVKVRVLSQQTNLSWHARGTVSVVVYLSIQLAELMTEAAASVASMVDTPLKHCMAMHACIHVS